MLPTCAQTCAVARLFVETPNFETRCKGAPVENRNMESNSLAGADHATSRHHGNSYALIVPLRPACRVPLLACHKLRKYKHMLVARIVQGLGHNRAKFLLHRPFKQSFAQMYGLTSSWLLLARCTAAFVLCVS